MKPRRSSIKRRSRRRSGIAAVETALFLPMLLILLAGIWEVGRILEVQQTLCTASRDAARQAGSGLLNNSQVQQAAIQSVQQGLKNSPNVNFANLTAEVAVYSKDNPNVAESIDVSHAQPLDLLKVTVSIPYHDVSWINLPMISVPTRLQAESTWLSLKNLPYPTDVPQPPEG